MKKKSDQKKYNKLHDEYNLKLRYLDENENGLKKQGQTICISFYLFSFPDKGDLWRRVTKNMSKKVIIV